LTAAFSYMFSLTMAHAQEKAEDFVSLSNLLEAGGWTLKLIIAISMIALFLIIFFLFTFRTKIIIPQFFVNEALAAAEEGDIEKLQNLCERNPSPAAVTIAAAADQLAASNNLDYFSVRDAVEDEGGRQASALWQRLQYLYDIAIIAPMVGLFGTVLGMMQSFSELQTEIGGVNSQTLTQGVAKALITTAGGLLVGIATMIVYALFRGRLSSLIGQMEQASNRILRAFFNTRTSEPNNQ